MCLSATARQEVEPMEKFWVLNTKVEAARACLEAGRAAAAPAGATGHPVAMVPQARLPHRPRMEPHWPACWRAQPLLQLPVSPSHFQRWAFSSCNPWPDGIKESCTGTCI